MEPAAATISTPAVQYRGIRALKHKDDGHREALAKRHSLPETTHMETDSTVSEGSITTPGGGKPKTLFESLVNPEPKAPQPKNARYLKLAGLPQSKSIGDYVMGETYTSSSSYERSRSMDASSSSLHQRRMTDPLALSSHDAPITNARDRIRRKLTGTAAKRSSSVPATARNNHLSDNAPEDLQHKNEKDERKVGYLSALHP
jgi:hypothetical protein